MEIRDPFDTAYLVAIMGLNGVAFFIIAICYGQIYLSLGEETRHAHSNSTGEMSVAKKMALLVRNEITTKINKDYEDEKILIKSYFIFRSSSPGIYKFCLLGSHSLLWIDSLIRLSVD